MTQYLHLLRKTFNEWLEDDIPRLAASISFYTALSLAPLLLLIISIVGFFFGDAAARGQVVEQLGGQIGFSTATFLEQVVENANNQSQGIISTVVSLTTLIIGATGVFMQLQYSLNSIWNIEVEDVGIITIIRKRLLSFGMIITLGFLLLVSLVINTGVASLDQFIVEILPQAQLIINTITAIFSFGISVLLFSILYRFMPDAKIAWKDVAIGAVVTAILFSAGRFVLSLYLGNVGLASTYGAAGSFVVILVWVYYSAQIVMFGAEFTQVYAREMGAEIMPDEGARFDATRLLKNAEIDIDDLKDDNKTISLDDADDNNTKPTSSQKDTHTTPNRNTNEAVKVVHHYPNEPLHTIIISAITALSGAIVGWMAQQFARNR